MNIRNCRKYLQKNTKAYNILVEENFLDIDGRNCNLIITKIESFKYKNLANNRHRIYLNQIIMKFMITDKFIFIIIRFQSNN